MAQVSHLFAKHSLGQEAGNARPLEASVLTYVAELHAVPQCDRVPTPLCSRRILPRFAVCRMAYASFSRSASLSQASNFVMPGCPRGWPKRGSLMRD